jgi:iron complex transport system substrate-binding protein
MRSGMLRALSVAGAILAGATCAGAQDALPDTSRLVTIGGSLTEIVYALGEQERLAARDSTSLYPAEALSLPDVGYMRQLSPEGVLSVRPSAIIALEGSGPPEAMDVLKAASVPLVEVPDEFDKAGVLGKIDIVGKALGVEDKAQALAAKVSADLDEAESLTKDIADRRRVLFVLSFQDGRILASGGGTAADGIIRMAGGINAVSGFEGYRPLADEALVEAAPDIVLMMDRGGDHAMTDAQLAAHAALAATPAGKDGRIVRLDGSYLLGFGPRTAGAVRDLARALYGDTAAP